FTRRKNISSGDTQVCPAFQSLPTAIRCATSRRSIDGCTSTGDLPPSSRITGTRFSAAAAMTVLPTAVEPVKISVSKGKRQKASEITPPPFTTATNSVGKASPSAFSRTTPKAADALENLIIVWLPAASAQIRGPIDNNSGQFPGAILPSPPQGCYCTQPLDG